MSLFLYIIIDHTSLLDKGLVINYSEGGGGGATKRERGASEVLPLQKKGLKKF